MATSTIAKLLIQLGLDTKKLQTGFNKVEGKLSKLGKTSSKFGMGVAAGLATIGAAAVSGIGVATVKAAEFEKEMKRVKAITGATEGEFKQLEQTAIKLSNQTGIATDEIIHGMQEMAKFGMDAEKIMRVLPDVMNATIATGKDFGTVMKVVEATMSEFGKTAEDTTHIVDVLTKISFATRADITKMGEAFKYAAPIAKQLGISMEDAAAMTGLMINAGFEGGIVGRTLRASFTRLAKPTEEAGNLLARLGVKIQDSHGNMLPFIGILEDLRQKTEGMGNAEKVAAMKTIFGMEAQSGMIAIMDKGGDALKELSLQLENAGGITEKVAKEMNDTLSGSIDRTSSRLNNLLTVIGAPFADALKGLLNAFNETFDSIFGESLEKLPGMMEGLKEKTIEVFQGIIDGLGANDFVEEIKRKLVELQKFWGQIWENVSKKFDEVWKKIKAFWDKHGSSIKLAFNKILLEISEIWDTTWDLAKDVFNTAWKFISNAFDLALDLLLDALTVFADVINGDWDKLWEDLGRLFKNAWNNIKKLFVDTLSDLAKLAWKWGTKLIGSFIEGIQNKMKALAGVASSAANMIKKFLGVASPTELGPLSQSHRWMPNMMDMFVKGIEQGMPRLKVAADMTAGTIARTNGMSEEVNNVSSNNTVNIYPQATTLNARQLYRELNRVSWMGGGAF